MNVKLLSILAATTLFTACSSLSDTVSTEQCKAVSEQEIMQLFDRWNASLKSGDVKQVVANYAADSVLLPTVSNKVRLTAEEKEDYFHHFLANAPAGTIDQRHIQIGCNTASDVGLYTFTYGKTGKKHSGRYSFNYRWDGKAWLITHHHSSLMPEKK
ncbi:SgcJ/EcaC family oxidoreductase [Glaesserella sp.]|uniref:SgcJ/EcaC family oxidoreductase n=1 Tax=Glaesserella sp. TaxID=2094731 RepID=UPI0035A0ECDC